MPYGARTVAELVAKPRFVVAHRGGSASWPEHTQRAYTQAVAYGVDALGVSCDYPGCTSSASSYLDDSLDDFSYQDKHFRHELDDKGWIYRTGYAESSTFAYCSTHNPPMTIELDESLKGQL